MTTVASHPYLNPRILAKITRLELRARLIVEGFITGQHKSPYQGFAVEFATHREYVPGDEIRHIDWKAWAKSDRLYIKEYEEETNLACTIVLDCSKSMAYGEKEDATRAGSGSNTDALGKFAAAATVAASLAYLLHRQQDSVGLVTFDNQVRVNLTPGAHPSHFKQVMHELEQARPDHRSDVEGVFHQLVEQVHQRGLIVLISDLFIDLAALEKAIRHFRHRRHEVLVLQSLHADEIAFPFNDNTLFKGLEIEQQLLTEPRALRKSYLEVLNNYLAGVRKICASIGVDYLLIDSGQPLDAALAAYLAFRQRTIRLTRRR